MARILSGSVSVVSNAMVVFAVLLLYRKAALAWRLVPCAHTDWYAPVAAQISVAWCRCNRASGVDRIRSGFVLVTCGAFTGTAIGIRIGDGSRSDMKLFG